MAKRQKTTLQNWPANNIEVWSLAEIKPYPNNPRTHPPAQITALANTMKDVGVTMPILVDDAGVIIAGHGRLLAAIEAGFEEYPVAIAVGWSEERKRAERLKDNTLGLMSGWDVELIKGEVGWLKSAGYQIPLLAIPQKQLKAWKIDGAPTETEEPAPPEPPKKAITRAGDLWLLGDHRILCGDSFEPEDVERLTGGKLVDLIVTDPPYAIYGSSTGIGTDIADDKMVRPFFEKLGALIAERLKEFGHAYICCDWRSYATLWHGMKSAKLAPKNCIVWDKGNAGLGANYANTHEFVAYFARLPKQTAMQSTAKRGQRTVFASNVWRGNRVSGAERQHNAAKPVAFMEWLIENSSDAGDVVADFFAGSGSTIMAAEKSKRHAIAMEMDPSYCDVVCSRWQEATKRDAVLEATGQTFKKTASARGERQKKERAAT